MLRHHAGQLDREPQAVLLESAPGAPPHTGVQKIFAQPIGPLEISGLKVKHRQQDALRKLRLTVHRVREERGIEHLKSGRGGGYADSGQLSNLTAAAAGRYDAKRFPQIVGDWLEIHLFQYRAPALDYIFAAFLISA